MAITTPPVRISYPNIFKAKSVLGGNPTFSITIMLDKNNKEHMECLKKLVADAEKAKKDKWPDPAKAPRIPVIGNDKSPIKDANKNCDSQGIPLFEKNPEYAGHYIIRASRVESQGKPVTVDRNNQDLLDSNTVYGGCFCKVNINAYAYARDVNKGVTFGLNGVQFWNEGEPFGAAQMTPDEMFGESSSEDANNYKNVDDDDTPF